MKIVILAAILGLALSSETNYIINGEAVTKPGKWPWQGSLRSWGSHSCGVTLISPTWGVSAAHCLEFEPSAYTVLFGTNNRFSGGVSTTVKQIIQHEEYGKGDGAFPNDIAVIEFVASISGDNIASIPLAANGSDHSGNEDCWITGWGYTVPGTSLPEILQEGKVNVYTKAECTKKWGSLVNAGHVCCGGSTTSCQGDSGGPVACMVKGRYEMVGITSWGPADCSTAYPAAYTRIAHFRDWIQTKTGV